MNVRGWRSEEKHNIQSGLLGGSVTEDLFERGLCLPSVIAMTNRDLNRAIKVMCGCHAKVQRRNYAGFC